MSTGGFSSSFDNSSDKPTGIIDGNYIIGGTQAHHLIPTNVAGEDVFEDFFGDVGYDNSSGDGNHNHTNNKMWLPSSNEDARNLGLTKHYGSHPRYDDYVRSALNDIKDKYYDALGNGADPLVAGEQARKDLIGLQNHLRAGLTVSFDADGKAQKPLLTLNNGDPLWGDAGKRAEDLVYDKDKMFNDPHFLEGSVNGVSNKDNDLFRIAPNSSQGGKILFADERARARMDVDGVGLDAGDKQKVRDLQADYDLNRAQAGLKDALDGGAGKLEILGMAIIIGSIIAKSYDEYDSLEDAWNDVKPLLEQADYTEAAWGLFTGVVTEGALYAGTRMAFGTPGMIVYLGLDLYELGRNAIKSLRQVFPENETLAAIDTTLDEFEALLKWAGVELANILAEAFGFDDFLYAEGDKEDSALAINAADGDQAILTSGWVDATGGAGEDWIIHTGKGEIHGDDGNDLLLAWYPEAENNQIQVKLFGGAGDDRIFTIRGDGAMTVAGGGEDVIFAYSGEDHVYTGWGSGAPDGEEDIIFLTHATFVHDAGKEDTAVWGILPATGGVKQFWQEGKYAYWMPVTAIASASPLPSFSSLGIVAAVMTDLFTGALMRYGISESGQLIAQFAFGWGGTAVFENYEIDYETGEATAGIAVIEQRLAENVTLEQFERYISLAFKAGFGINLEGKDPLILDLDGDGYDLIREEHSTVYFDLDLDGFAEKSAWVAPDDGFLARDLNGDGVINDVGELFGDAETPGLTALAALDSNGDGKITSADAAFGELLIWRDLDSDGETDPGELQTLTEAGIAEISLTDLAPQDGEVRGNEVRAEAVVTRADGSTTTAGDVLLRTSETDSRYLGDATVSAQAAALPELRGYGEMTSLRIAMTADAALAQSVADFAALPATTDWASLRGATDAILYEWAGVAGDAATPIGDTGLDTRQLAFLEKYFGYQLLDREPDGTVKAFGAEEALAGWTDALERAAARLAAQGPLATVLTGASYDAAADHFVAATADTLTDAYAAAIAALPSDAGQAGASWADLWGPALAAWANALVRADGVEARTDYEVQSLLRALDTTASPLTLTELVAGLGLPNVHLGGAGDDMLARSEDKARMVYVAGAGDDQITGGFGQDVYVFGRDFGQDVILDGEGRGRQSGDRIRLALHTADDVTVRRDGLDLVIEVKNSTDRITVIDQFATPTLDTSGLQQSPNWGIEDIQFGDGTIWEFAEIAAAVGEGTDQAETLTGSGQTDVLQGMKGDDLLLGGDDGDIYIHWAGDGHDVIHDVMTNPLIAMADVLLIKGGATMEDVTLTRVADSADVSLTVGDAGDAITIRDQFKYSVTGFETDYALNNRIEGVYFDDGPSWSWLDLQHAVISTYTTDGADVTYGFGTADSFSASAGDDLLIGFDGGDVYEFDVGSGADVIHDRSAYLHTVFSEILNYGWDDADVLRFGRGLTPDDVTFARPTEAADLVIATGDLADTLTVTGQFDAIRTDLLGLYGLAWFDRVERFEFDDGTVLSWEDVLGIVTTGGDGDDQLWGAYYADTLDGKAGDDFLSGGDEGDTYVFGRGYGADVIEDNQTNVLDAADDRVLFNADVAVGDVGFARDGTSDDLLITIAGSTDSLRIRNQYDAFATGVFGTQAFDRIERFEWADGTVKTWDEIAAETIAAAGTAGDDTILGTAFDDVLDGQGGADRLEGGEGDDTYVFDRGYGDDVVRDEQDLILLGGDGDTVSFAAGVAPGDVEVLRGAGDDLLLRISDTGETLTLEGQLDATTLNWRPTEIESVEFADGTVWGAADLRIMAIASQQSAGADMVEGTFDDDVITGGAGDDTLRGQDGSDTYVFDRGFGQDVIEEGVQLATASDFDVVSFIGGIAPSEVSVSRGADPDDLVLTVGADSVRIDGQFTAATLGGAWKDIEEIHFGDGTIWTSAELRQRLVDEAATAGADVIEGFAFAETFDGGAGDDTLRGRGGADTYLFGLGAGADVIEESYGTVYQDQPDTVVFGAGIATTDVAFARVGDDLVATIAGASDTLTVANHFGATSARVELFRFADGTVLTAAQAEANAFAGAATSGADTITGTAAAEVLDGGAGDDLLSGGEGADVYVFDRGYGADRVEDNGDWGGARLTHPDRVSFGAGVAPEDLTLTRSGDDLVITIAGAADQLTITDQFAFSFSDILGTEQKHRIEEFAFADGAIWSEAQVDAMVLAGQATAGADTITGYQNAETLDGGAGDDLLLGGFGPDTYLFNRGGGADVIDDHGDYGDDAETYPDVLRFGPGITAPDLRLERSGDDLIVHVQEDGVDAGDRVTIQNQFHYSDSDLFGFYNRDQIERVEFADGSGLTWEALRLATLDQAATAGDDAVTGYESDDTLLGRAGADTLAGGYGADVLQGGTGDDILRGQKGGDVYIFARGDGSDTVEDSGDGGTDGPDNADEIRFASGVAAEDVTLARDGLDLILTIAGETDQIRVTDQFRTVLYQDAGYESLSRNRIESFSFSDGTVWTAEEVDARVLAGQATAGADTVTGYDSSEILEGGAGDDLLIGGKGADAFVLGLGYGHDRIADDGDGGVESADAPDRVIFKIDIAPEDVVLSRTGDDLVITVGDGADSLTVEGQFTTVLLPGVGYESRVKDRIESFEFADGTIWSAAEVDAMTLSNQQTPGDDVVWGYDAAETLDGRAGNDLLIGGKGADAYRFGFDYGQDVIADAGDEGAASALTPDRVVFAPGVTQADLSYAVVGDDLQITLTGGSDVLTIQDQFHNVLAADGFYEGFLADRIERFEFADGSLLTAAEVDQLAVDAQATSGADTITAFNGHEILDGGAGDDRLEGQGGADTYRFGAGSGADVIHDDEQAGWNESLDWDDAVEFVGLNPADLSFTQNGDDLIATIVATGETLRVERQFDAADGFRWRIERFLFADGTEWSPTELAAALSTATPGLIEGTAAAETLTGTDGADTLDGRGGADTLNGGLGSDVFLWRKGDGDDVIAELGDPTDVERLSLEDATLSEVAFRRSSTDADDLLVTIGAETITVDEHFAGNATGIEEVATADGQVLDRARIQELADAINGTAGADTLAGTTGADLLIGGQGDDTLNGGDGSDVYRFSAGDGVDLIEDNGGGDNDRVEIRGHTLAQTTFTVALGDDLVLNFAGSSDQITLKNSLDGDYFDGIEELAFEDGTVLDAAGMRAHAIAGQQSSGDDVITGFKAADTLEGGLGNDTLSGGDGSDDYVFTAGDGQDVLEDNGGGDTDRIVIHGYAPTDVSYGVSGLADLVLTFAGSTDSITAENTLDGGYFDTIEELVFDDGTVVTAAEMRVNAIAGQQTSGNDDITGFDSADVIEGGLGDDQISGGDGGDTYRFNAGDGSDVIEDNGGGDTDVIEISGYTADEISVGRDGDALLLAFSGGDDAIRVINTLDGNYFDQIERIDMDGGTSWTIADITARFSGVDAAVTHAGTTGADTLIGTAGSDVFLGKGGADVFEFRPGGGDDRIDDFEDGSDQIRVTHANAVYADLAISQDGADALVTLAGETLRLTGRNAADLGADDFLFGSS